MKFISRQFSCLGLALVLMATSGCFRNEKKTLTLLVPQLAGKTCGDLIRARLLDLNEEASGRSLKFFYSVEYDLTQRTVTVVYQSTVTAGMNVLQLIADLGFNVSDANDPKRALPGNPESRKKLPAACQ